MIAVQELQTIADTGMLVVLWMVQLVIYPSFLSLEGSKLIDWHKTYTFRVSFIIIPFMFTQLGCAVVFAVREGRMTDWLVLALVLLCWALTFFISLPLHHKISQGDLSPETRCRLISTNWPRTLLWTAIFVAGNFSR